MEIDAKAVLYMVAKEFGLKRDSFGERLRLQKVVYLLQGYGIQLGYGFGWYKYGPYSQDLVSDAYAVLGSRKSEYDRAAKDGEWGFDKATKAKFGEFQQLCGEFLNSPEKIELLASVRFVKIMWCPDVGVDDFVEEFMKRKPRLCNNVPADRQEIKNAFELSKKIVAA